MAAVQNRLNRICEGTEQIWHILSQTHAAVCGTGGKHEDRDHRASED